MFSNNPINLELPTMPLGSDQESVQLALWQAQMHWLATVGIAPPPPAKQEEANEAEER